MSYIFVRKAVFGSLRENIYQGDYIIRKKSKLIHCNTPAVCNKQRNSNSYDNINLFKMGCYLNNCNMLHINNNNLVIGKYTKVDLTGINNVTNILSDPIKIDTINNTNPFYFDNNIFSYNNLACGKLNYIKPNI
jgi:hypothetical protein